MLRREFLAAAGAALSPTFVKASRKSDSALPRVGAGEHTYECRHDWLQLPAEFEWQTTHNVAVDSSGLVYVTHQGHGGKKGLDAVFVFDAVGKFVRSFGKEWHGGGHGVDVRKEGGTDYLYFCNTWAKTCKVAKTTTAGELVWKLERPECPEYADAKRPYYPTNIAFLPDGGFVVGDGYGSHYLMAYSADRKLTKVFGGPGKGDGQFQTPHGLWVDTRSPAPTLVVCDRANARLQTFGLDGAFRSKTAPGTVLFPANIDLRGDVLLVSDLHARISLFGKDGALLANLGDDPVWRKNVLGTNMRADSKRWEAGKFVHPHDACFDLAGNILVAEWVDGGRMTFLKKVG